MTERGTTMKGKAIIIDGVEYPPLGSDEYPPAPFVVGLTGNGEWMVTGPDDFAQTFADAEDCHAHARGLSVLQDKPECPEGSRWESRETRMLFPMETAV